jgi:hypothetical protein
VHIGPDFEIRIADFTNRFRDHVHRATSVHICGARGILIIIEYAVGCARFRQRLKTPKKGRKSEMDTEDDNSNDDSAVPCPTDWRDILHIVDASRTVPCKSFLERHVTRNRRVYESLMTMGKKLTSAHACLTSYQAEMARCYAQYQQHGERECPAVYLVPLEIWGLVLNHECIASDLSTQARLCSASRYTAAIFAALAAEREAVFIRAQDVVSAKYYRKLRDTLGSATSATALEPAAVAALSHYVAPHGLIAALESILGRKGREGEAVDNTLGIQIREGPAGSDGWALRCMGLYMPCYAPLSPIQQVKVLEEKRAWRSAWAISHPHLPPGVTDRAVVREMRADAWERFWEIYDDEGTGNNNNNNNHGGAPPLLPRGLESDKKWLALCKWDTASYLPPGSVNLLAVHTEREGWLFRMPVSLPGTCTTDMVHVSPLAVSLMVKSNLLLRVAVRIETAVTVRTHPLDVRGGLLACGITPSMVQELDLRFTDDSTTRCVLSECAYMSTIRTLRLTTRAFMSSEKTADGRVPGFLYTYPALYELEVVPHETAWEDGLYWVSPLKKLFVALGHRPSVRHIRVDAGVLYAISTLTVALDADTRRYDGEFDTEEEEAARDVVGCVVRHAHMATLALLEQEATLRSDSIRVTVVSPPGNTYCSQHTRACIPGLLHAAVSMERVFTWRDTIDIAMRHEELHCGESVIPTRFMAAAAPGKIVGLCAYASALRFIAPASETRETDMGHIQGLREVTAFLYNEQGAGDDDDNEGGDDQEQEEDEGDGEEGGLATGRENYPSVKGRVTYGGRRFARNAISLDQIWEYGDGSFPAMFVNTQSTRDPSALIGEAYQSYISEDEEGDEDIDDDEEDDDDDDDHGEDDDIGANEQKEEGEEEEDDREASMDMEYNPPLRRYGSRMRMLAILREQEKERKKKNEADLQSPPLPLLLLCDEFHPTVRDTVGPELARYYQEQPEQHQQPRQDTNKDDGASPLSSSDLLTAYAAMRLIENKRVRGSVRMLTTSVTNWMRHVHELTPVKLWDAHPVIERHLPEDISIAMDKEKAAALRQHAIALAPIVEYEYFASYWTRMQERGSTLDASCSEQGCPIYVAVVEGPYMPPEKLSQVLDYFRHVYPSLGASHTNTMCPTALNALAPLCTSVHNVHEGDLPGYLTDIEDVDGSILRASPELDQMRELAEDLEYLHIFEDACVQCLCTRSCDCGAAVETSALRRKFLFDWSTLRAGVPLGHNCTIVYRMGDRAWDDLLKYGCQGLFGPAAYVTPLAVLALSDLCDRVYDMRVRARRPGVSPSIPLLVLEVPTYLGLYAMEPWKRRACLEWLDYHMHLYLTKGRTKRYRSRRGSKTKTIQIVCRYAVQVVDLPCRPIEQEPRPPNTEFSDNDVDSDGNLSMAAADATSSHGGVARSEAGDPANSSSSNDVDVDAMDVDTLVAHL